MEKLTFLQQKDGEQEIVKQGITAPHNNTIQAALNITFPGWQTGWESAVT
jgi:hypothetical protein